MTERKDIDCSGQTALALWYAEPRRCEIRSAILPRLPQGHYRVRTLASAVSRGTESLVFQGMVPEREWERMRAPHQEGMFPFPVKYGYACAGVVEAGPASRIGEKVFGLFPHQTHFDATSDTLLSIPPDIPVERAVLAANLETALNALWDGLPSPGDHICVVGGGVVGLLTGYLASKIPGTLVRLVDVNETRASIAQALGMEFSGPNDTPVDQDLVFHASATADGLKTALTCAGDEATVVELSWFGMRSITVPLGMDFHSRRLTLKSSQVGTIPPVRQARWSFNRRLTAALSLLNDPVLDGLVSHRIPFEDGPTRLPALLEGHEDALAPILIYA